MHVHKHNRIRTKAIYLIWFFSYFSFHKQSSLFCFKSNIVKTRFAFNNSLSPSFLILHLLYKKKNNAKGYVIFFLHCLSGKRRQIHCILKEMIHLKPTIAPSCQKMVYACDFGIKKLWDFLCTDEQSTKRTFKALINLKEGRLCVTIHQTQTITHESLGSLICFKKSTFQ